MINEERDRLRRIAYGPDATAKERVAAEAGLRRLEEQEQAPLVAGSAAEASAHHTPDQASAVHDERDDEENSSEGEASDDEVTGAPLWGRGAFTSRERPTLPEGTSERQTRGLIYQLRMRQPHRGIWRRPTGLR